MTIPHGYAKWRMGGLASLYKGSERAPADVFANGWGPKEGSIDIVNHILNDGAGSCWYSTSLDRFVCATWGRYVYKIRGVNDEAIVANEAYLAITKKGINQIPFVEQKEMSVYQRIPADCVFGYFDVNDGHKYTANPAIPVGHNFDVWGEQY